MIPKESRIQETLSLSTNANRSTATERNIQEFFAKIIIKKKWQWVPPAEGEIFCKCASIALQKVLACPEIFVVYNIFLPNYHMSYRLFAFFPEMCGGISNKSRNIFFISKVIKIFNLVISITLANKEPKVSQIMGLFLEMLETIKTFCQSLNKT